MLSYFFAQEQHPRPVASTSSKSQHTEKTSLAGKRVVIAEDEGITQLQLSRMLRAEGIEVVGAAVNGKEAVDIVLRERPDLVLMDIRMPIMDGLEASKRILAEYRVCIVMLTALSDKEYQEHAREIGTSGYFIKPVTTENLMPQLQAAWQRFRQS